MTPGFLKFLRVINSGDRRGGVRTFPQGLADKDLRYDEEKYASPIAWLGDKIKDCLADRPEPCLMDERLAVLAKIVVGKDDSIEYANVQVVVGIGAAVHDLLCGARGEAQYIRLDLDSKNISPLFCEDLPHIHMAPEGEPRLPLRIDPTGNVIVDFFDFVYRSYCWDLWQEWLIFTWEKRSRKAYSEDDVLRPLFLTLKQEAQKRTVRLEDVERECAKAVGQVKALLKSERAGFTKLRMKRCWRTFSGLHEAW